MSVNVRVSGPFFDSRADIAVHDFLQEALDEVAGQGLANWHNYLDASIKHPTPYYETQITVERAGTERVVHDRGIVYGPWLEGVGSKNRTTRFKGYHSLRKATQELHGQAQALVEHVLKRYLSRMQ